MYQISRYKCTSRISLEADLLRASPCMNRCIQHGHSSRVGSELRHHGAKCLELFVLSFMVMVDRMATPEPEPLQRSCVWCDPVAELFPSIQVSDPEIAIKIFLLEQLPSGSEPIYTREPHMCYHELGASSATFDLGLPRHSKQPIVCHSELARLDMDGIVEPQGRKDHAQPPPDEQSSWCRFTLIHHKELKAPDHWWRDRHCFLESFGSSVDHICLHCQESLVVDIRALYGKFVSDPFNWSPKSWNNWRTALMKIKIHGIPNELIMINRKNRNIVTL